MKSLRSPRLCEAVKAPDDFFKAAKLDFVARRKLILWVDFRRRKVDVRGEMTFAAGHVGDDLSYKGKDAAWKAALRKQIPRSRLCRAAKAPDDFLNAAKLILLVDVRGEMTFAAENGVRDDSDYMRGGRLPSVDSGERLGVWRRGGRGRIRERGPQPQI